MQETFKFILKSRQKFIELIEGLSIEQLNKIPVGFNNNIIDDYAYSTNTTIPYIHYHLQVPHTSH